MIDAISAATQAATGQVSTTAQPGGELGKDEFLNLLVAQLRNQDPLNPSDPKDFAAQLAQFSTVEQLIKIGDQLTAQSDRDTMVIGAINAGTAVQFLGHSVLMQGNDVTVPGQGPLDIQVDVQGAGGSGELVLYDDTGKEAARLSVKNLDAGRQTIDASTVVGTLPAGSYTYDLQIADGSGAKVPVTPYSVVRITGIRYDPTGPVLLSGANEIALDQILEIIE